jgi:hypothetical protein
MAPSNGKLITEEALFDCNADEINRAQNTVEATVLH